jgi:hypothetical protein
VDVGAGLVRVLARPLRVVAKVMAGSDDDVAEIRSRASRPSTGLSDAVNGLIDRGLVWLMLTAAHIVPLAVVLDLLERVLPVTISDFLWSFFQATLVSCAMTAVLVGFRLGFAWYTDEDRWAARRRTLRSGNKDLAISTIVVLFFVLISALVQPRG